MIKMMKRALVYGMVFLGVALACSIVVYMNNMGEYEAGYKLGVQLSRPTFDFLFNIKYFIIFIVGCETGFQMKKFFQK